jgi:hypothetical protein
MKKTFTYLVVVLCGLYAAGCGKVPGLGSSAPSNDDFRAQLAASLPAYVKVEAVETESIGNNAYNFKATLSTREPLYIEAKDAQL